MPLSVVLCRRRDRMWQSTIPRLTRKANCHTVTLCQYTLCPLPLAMHRQLVGITSPVAARLSTFVRSPWSLRTRVLTVVRHSRRRPPVTALRSCRPPPAAFRRSPFRLACSSARLGPVSAVPVPVPPCLSRPPTPTAARQNPGVVLECRRLFVDSFKTWTLDNDEKMRSPCVLGGVIFSISEAEVRTDTHNTHADAHTHGTCTSKGNGQQIIATPQHTTPKTDSPSNTSSYACRMPPHAHLPQTWPRPKRTTPPVPIAVVQWLACLC